MTPEDLEDLGARLIALADLLPPHRPLSAQVLDLYLAAIEDLPIESLRRALNQAAQQSAFFPPPATIRAWVNGSPEDRAVRAYQGLREALRVVGGYRSLTVDDPATAVALARVYGGWIGFADADQEDTPMQEARRKEFLATYRSVDTLGVRAQTQRFPGRHAAANQLTGGSWKRGQLVAQEEGRLLLTGTVTLEREPAALPAGEATDTPPALPPVDLVAELRRRLSAGTSPAPTPTEEDA